MYSIVFGAGYDHKTKDNRHALWIVLVKHGFESAALSGILWSETVQSKTARKPHQLKVTSRYLPNSLLRTRTRLKRRWRAKFRTTAVTTFSLISKGIWLCVSFRRLPSYCVLCHLTRRQVHHTWSLKQISAGFVNCAQDANVERGNL